LQEKRRLHYVYQQPVTNQNFRKTLARDWRQSAGNNDRAKDLDWALATEVVANEGCNLCPIGSRKDVCSHESPGLLAADASIRLGTGRASRQNFTKPYERGAQ
jgi:hypothetical protein